MVMSSVGRNALARRIASRRARYAGPYERAFDEGLITGAAIGAKAVLDMPVSRLLAPMGDFSSAAIGALAQAGGALGTGAKVIQDPYLPEVLCRVNQLAEIEAGTKVTPCPAMAPGRAGGIGLRKVVAPLRAYVYAEQHPWVYPLGIAAVIGIPFLIGYLAGE